jgi:hypothetical protein
MSAVAKLRALGGAAFEEVLAPIVSAHEQRQQQEAEAQAAEARAALARFPRTTKELKQAEALVAKSKADEAAAEADLLKAKARTAEAEVAYFGLSQQHAAQLHELRKAAHADHAWREARELLADAAEMYRQKQPAAPAGKIAVRLYRKVQQINAAHGGAEDPPADDLVQWARDAIEAAATDFAALVQQHLTEATQHAARERAARVLG